MLQKIQGYCAREEIRGRLILVILSLIVLVYGLITIFGHTLPQESANMPRVLRLHPERILAMVAAVLGGLRLIDQFQKDESPVQPLLWILFASLVHLASIGSQLGWFSAGRN